MTSVSPNFIQCNTLPLHQIHILGFQHLPATTLENLSRKQRGKISSMPVQNKIKLNLHVRLLLDLCGKQKNNT